MKQSKEKEQKKDISFILFVISQGLTIKLNFNRNLPIVASLLSNSSFYFISLHFLDFMELLKKNQQQSAKARLLNIVFENCKEGTRTYNTIIFIYHR